MNDFNVEEFLTTTEFTIPVKIEEKKGATKTINVTYNFTDEIAEQFRKKPSENGDSSEDVKVMEVLNKQLATMVKKIDGVDTPPDETFWSRTRLRYRKSILQAIMEDVYPNVKTSGA